MRKLAIIVGVVLFHFISPFRFLIYYHPIVTDIYTLFQLSDSFLAKLHNLLLSDSHTEQPNALLGKPIQNFRVRVR